MYYTKYIILNVNVSCKRDIMRYKTFGRSVFRDQIYTPEVYDECRSRFDVNTFE